MSFMYASVDLGLVNPVLIAQATVKTAKPAKPDVFECNAGSGTNCTSTQAHRLELFIFYFSGHLGLDKVAHSLYRKLWPLVQGVC